MVLLSYRILFKNTFKCLQFLLQSASKNDILPNKFLHAYRAYRVLFKKKRFQNSVEKREILSHRKNIPWIQLLSNFISTVKLLRSQNFYQKSVRENFRNFHTVIAWQKFRQNDDIISSTYKEWKVFSRKNVDFSVKIVIVTLYVSQCGNFSKSLPCSNFSSKHFIENVAELP